MASPYQSTWRSLRQHQTPQWLRDAKFGIYTHWGVYSVPAFGPNGSWYPYLIYQDGTEQQKHHLSTYGPLDSFGYKDFIPHLTADKFDAAEWADLFKAAGARFAGPVGEHHDGFTMWDTRYSEWHAGRVGPQRDVVAEQEKAFRAAGLRFMVALHHAEWWWFYPHWRHDFDTGVVDASSLYGERHNLEWTAGPPDLSDHARNWDLQAPPSKAFLDQWIGKTKEVIDRFSPDLLWFDFGISMVQEHYLRDCFAYYYNHAAAVGQEVVATYKWNHLVPGSALVDVELGGFGEQTYHEWLTDTSIDNQGAWSYVEDAVFKTPAAIIHNLADNVSQNGHLLLNVGPRPDGTIPEGAQEVLRSIGSWLQVNGEALFETTPWLVFGEGPTQPGQGGPFSEKGEVTYSGADVRYTSKGDAVYAICLGRPPDRLQLTALSGRRSSVHDAPFLYPDEISGVSMLGSEEPVSWEQKPDSLTIHCPEQRPSDDAVVFKIERRNPYS